MVDQRRFDNQPSDFLGAKAAAKLLGVEVRTLYAYASRGLVRSVRGKGLQRQYAKDDLDRLKARSGARAGHGAVAAGALRWGEPVLDSAITLITPRGPAYRGQLALDLVGTRFENVAELLWSGYLPSEPITWPRAALSLANLGKLMPPTARPLEVMSLLVPLAGIADPQRADGRPDAFIARCRMLIPLLAASLGWGAGAAHVTRALAAPSVAMVCARALGLDDALAPALETVLVVLADHELNASSFAARVAASTDADPYACFAAALATLSGPRHGSAAEALVAYLDAPKGTPPGFGHRLYPAGDPRTAPVMALATRSTKRARAIFALAEKHAHPTVDVALAALMASLNLPPAAGSGLFAVARSAGWLAHVLEQRAAGFLLRPRARYTGVTP